MNRPQLVGIVNITPDSFSGDGRQGDDAVSYAHALIEAGADLLDIGAESTRPGATPLDADEEWARLAPFFSALGKVSIPLSVDTRHVKNTARVLDLGVQIINDVGGLQNPAMLEMLGASACDIIVMHALTIPADKRVVWPEGTDPIETILAWKQETLARAAKYDINADRLIFDPGLGFGKTPKQSLALIEGAAELTASGGRWLFGHSRKSFLTLFTDAPASERDALTLKFSEQLAQAGVHYLRVHNVAAHHSLLCT